MTKNRPPYNRNKSRKVEPGGNSQSGETSIKNPRIWRKLRNIAFLVIGATVLQFMNSGTVTWPQDLWRKVAGTVGDYAGRPEAGWRKATDALENVGAAKEGQPVPDFDFTGRVVRVADGDTVSILDARNKQHKVRLYGIDTPERDQPYGKKSRAVLSKWVADEYVGVVVVEKDDYGRTVGTLYHEETNINAAMVASGNAWWYRHYAPNNRLLAESEKTARKQALGLWSEQDPIPPWDWRRSQRK